jgi:hypothetical protein
MPADIHSLAPETRKTIFKLALTHDSLFSIKGIYPDYHGRGATTTLTRKHLAATQLNQLFRSEALKIFYGENKFAVCLSLVCVVNPKVVIRGKVQKKRSYGDVWTAEWVRSLSEEAVREIRLLRVYVACVTRWRDDEGGKEVKDMEVKKCKAYGVADILGTKAMTPHLLFDKCSGRRLFYEIDLAQGGGVESFVETVEGCEEKETGEKYWGGVECTVCMTVLTRWLNGVGVVGGRKVVSREKMRELLW